jgi:hypothetical protein
MIRTSFRVFAMALLLCCAAGAAMCQVGQWRIAAHMHSPRRGLGAATGLDGRIYAVGGSNNYGLLLSSAEAYDPGTDTWTLVKPMSTARVYFGCVTGPDGRIYAIGGGGGGGNLASAEAYDTRTNQWSPLAPLHINTTTAQVNSAAVGNDGRIYAFISTQASAGNFTQLVTAYDIHTNTWSSPIYPPVTLPYESYSAIASDAGGRIYVAGGSSQSGQSVANLFVFDPLGGGWAAGSPLPTARPDLALAPAGDGRLYAIGGTEDYESSVAAVAAYDPVKDAWASVGPLNVSRQNLAATMGRDGRVYALGGWLRDPVADIYIILDSVEVYQPGQTSSGPVVSADSIQAVAGVAFNSFVGGFTDTNYPYTTDYSVSIDWGDGQTSPGTVSAYGNGVFDVLGTHTYAKAGSYVTKIAVTDAGGNSGSSSGTAQVADPSLTASGLSIVIISKSFSGVVATFRDTNPSSVSLNFTATIQWGDGTSSAGAVSGTAGAGFSVSSSHSYRKTGVYNVTVSIRDVDGRTAVASTTINVRSGK